MKNVLIQQDEKLFNSWCIVLDTLSRLFETSYYGSIEMKDYSKKYVESLISSDFLGKIHGIMHLLNSHNELNFLLQPQLFNSDCYWKTSQCFHDIQLSLANIVFYSSIQCEWPIEFFEEILKHLMNRNSMKTPCVIDSITVKFLFAVLNVLDAENHTWLFENLKPIFDLFGREWKCGVVKKIVLFVAGVAMAKYNNQSASQIDPTGLLVDAVTNERALDVVCDVLLECETILKDEMYLNRLHKIMADFVNCMPSKIHIWLKNNSMVSMRSSSRSEIDVFLSTLEKLYAKNQPNFDLNFNYWNPADILSTNWIAELIECNSFVPYIKMVTKISSRQQTAAQTFQHFLPRANMSKCSATLGSWDQIFSFITDNYKLVFHILTDINRVYKAKSTYFISLFSYRVMSQCQNNFDAIQISKLRALINLIGVIAANDGDSQSFFCTKSEWAVLYMFSSFLFLNIDLLLKSDILLALSALGKSIDTFGKLWTVFEENKVLDMIIDEHITRNTNSDKNCKMVEAIVVFLHTVVSTLAEDKEETLQKCLKVAVENILLRFYNG